MSRLVVELPRPYLQCKAAMWEWIKTEYGPHYVSETMSYLIYYALSVMLERSVTDFIQGGFTDTEIIDDWEEEHVRDIVIAMFDSNTTHDSRRLIHEFESASLYESNFACMVISAIALGDPRFNYLLLYEAIADTMNFVIQSAFEAFRPIEIFEESFECETYNIPTHCYEVEIREQSRVLILGVA